MISGKRGRAIERMLFFIFWILVGAILSIMAFTFMEDLFKGQADYATENNVQQLAKAINSLAESGKQLAYATIPIYVSEDYILVGFGKNQDRTSQACTEETAMKPDVPQCQEACICGFKNSYGEDFGDDTDLAFCAAVNADVIASINYKGKSSFIEGSRTAKEDGIQYLDDKDKNRIKIASGFSGTVFGEYEAIRSEYYTEIPPKYEYTSFALYGECYELDDPFGLQYITLEMLKIKNQKYLTIFYRDTVDLTERQKELDKLLVPKYDQYVETAETQTAN